jgi:hypothetical protein
MLAFVTLRSNYPELRMWGAQVDKLTFVITKDEEEFEFEACVKTVGREGNHSLGAFHSFDAAKFACETFLSKRGTW